MLSTKKKSDKEKEPIQDIPFLILNDKPKLRTVGLYGEVDEEKSADVTHMLLNLRESGKHVIYEDPADLDSKILEIKYEPIDFYISTWGGSAADMFAIYDAMRIVREDCEICTVGMGKVMSAGVLLLAAGTKGSRRIGANCRVMLHSIMGGNYGPIYNLENEMEEMRWLQEQHIKALISETDITKKHLKKLLDRKVNVYLTADEAVDLGIADEVV